MKINQTLTTKIIRMIKKEEKLRIYEFNEK